MQLRPYQEEALTKIIEAEARGVRRPLVSLPTGTGKTVLFTELVRRRLPTIASRTLILSHRDELLTQAAEKLATIAPTLPLGIVKAERDHHTAPVILASIQTLSRPHRMKRLHNVRTIIIDEAHHATAESYRRVLDHCNAFTPDGPLVLGVTATPHRADGQGLTADVFQEIVYERGLLEMIREQYLADLTAKQIALAVDFNHLHTRAGDYAADEVEEMLAAADAPRYVAEAIVEHAPDRKSLIFTPSVSAAHRMAEAVSAHGLTAEALDGAMSIEQRRGTLARLRSGETQVVANCAVLTEGFDDPSLDCIVIARPTKSKPLYAQMVGRGTRKFPGKENCLVLDVVGCSTRHDLMTLGSAFDVSEQNLRSRSLAEGAALQEAERRAQREMVELAGRLVAQTVDLFKRRELHWVTVSPTHFVLPAGKAGTVTLRQDSNGWSASVTTATGGQQMLMSGVDIELAQGIGEDFVRRAGVESLVSRSATWRSAAPTENQLAALQRMRVRVAAGLTRGEASDLIARKVAGKPRWRR